MCDRPRLIDNPYLGLAHIGLNRFHDCTSLKLPVPCGNCPSCIALRQNYYIQRCQMEELNHHLFMVTLTYRQSMLRHLVVNGRKLYYADFTDLQKMFKRLRNRGFNFSYMAVNEYGGKHHRPHFHLLLSVPKNKDDTFHDCLNLEHRLQDLILGEWRRNYGSDKAPIYKDLCQLVISPYGRTFDLHYVNPSLTENGSSDVGFYVTKYVLKADKWVDRLKSALKLNLEPDKFQEVWRLLRPRVCISKSFGSYTDPDVISHIRKGIDFAKLIPDARFPYFINPVTGQTFPLSPLYQKRFLTVADKEVFFNRNKVSDDGFTYSDDRNIMKENVSDNRFNHVRNVVNSRLSSYDEFYDSEKLTQIDVSDIDVVSQSEYVDDDWQNDF